MFEKILFATSASSTCDDAARVAFELSRKNRSRLSVFHVFGLPSRGFGLTYRDVRTGEQDEVDENLVSLVKEEMGQYYEKLAKDHPSCVFETATGEPHTEILRKARKEDASLIVMPVAAADGTLLLAAQLPLSDVAGIFEGAGLPEGTTLVVAEKDGRILYRLPELPGHAVARLPADQEAGLRGDSPESYGWAVGLDGVERYYVIKRLDICPGEACFVRVGIPRDAVYATSGGKLTRHLLTLALIVGLTLLLARVWARRNILAPAARIMETVRLLHAGDYTARTGLAEAEAAGELDELAGSVDHMAQGTKVEKPTRSTPR